MTQRAGVVVVLGQIVSAEEQIHVAPDDSAMKRYPIRIACVPTGCVGVLYLVMWATTRGMRRDPRLLAFQPRLRFQQSDTVSDRYLALQSQSAHDPPLYIT